MPSSLIDTLVSHILDTSFEAFSADDIKAGKMRLIDALSCTVSGRGAAGNDAMATVIRNMGGLPQASVLASDEKLPLPYAALVNSLQLRSFDFEVCGPEPEGANAGKMVGHVASTTEPTALNVGEFVHASGREMLAAVILGGDVAARISVSNKFNFDADFEVCGTSNAFGATAVAGRLLGLSHEQLRNAFGILLNLMAGSYQGIWDGAASFKLPGAMAAYNGILSCQLSLEGFSGVSDALESRLGFFHLYAPEPQPENALVDLGKVFYVKGSHKLHPSCYGNHNAIDCSVELHEEYGLGGDDDIESVTVDVRQPLIDHFLNQVATAEDDQPKFLFTMPYAVANALHRGRPELDHYTTENIYDPTVLGLTRRVVLEPNLGEGFLYAARVRVKMKDGRELERFRDSEPRGWLETPASYDDVVAKFWRNIQFRGELSQEKAERALHMLHHIEEVADVAALAEALSLPSGNPSVAPKPLQSGHTPEMSLGLTSI